MDIEIKKKLKITLDTGCINTKPDSDLDKIFELNEKKKIEVYIPDGVIKDILNDEFNLSDVDSIPENPKGIKVKQRFEKINKCFTLKGTLICGDDVYGRVGGTAGGKNVEDYEDKISSIINSAYDYEDIRILMLHFSEKNDFFITRNSKHFIVSGKREKFFKELGVTINTPDEFISYFNEHYN